MSSIVPGITETGLGIADLTRARVVLAPVGGITQSTFQKYKSMIERCDEVEVAQLTPFDVEKSAFKDRQWHLQHGHVRLRFVDAEATTSPFQDMQLHRKVLAVIGIMHCPRHADLREAHSDFMRICRQYPNAMAVRCLAFEPMDSQMDVMMDNFFMIPNQGETHLRFYISTLVTDMAATLLKNCISCVRSPDAFVGTSPFDYSDNSSESDRQSKIKKRRAARATKFTADFLLAAGSAKDALILYEAAAEQLRSNNDWAWLGAALEGMATATLVIHTVDPGTLDLTDNGQPVTIDDRIITLCNEAISNYLLSTAPPPQSALAVGPAFSSQQRPRPNPLAAECALRLGRHLSNPVPHARVRPRLQESLDALTQAASISLLLSAADRLVILGECARCAHALGAKRKAAFFMRQIAVLYRDADVDNKIAAFSLMAAIVPIYLLDVKPTLTANANAPGSGNNGGAIPPVSSSSSADDSESPYPPRQVMTRSGKRNEPCGWPVVQLRVMRDMIEIAKASNDLVTTFQLTLFALGRLYSELDESSQNRLLAELAQLAPFLPAHAKPALEPPPILRAVLPKNLPPHLDPVLTGVSQQKGIFIYSPFEKSSDRKKAMSWAADTVCKVVIKLDNPFAFDMALHDICLKTKDVPFEPYSGEALLRARTFGNELVLYGRPLAAGSLIITGVTLRIATLSFHSPLFLPVPIISPTGEDPPITIPVFPTLPLLSVQSRLFNTSHMTLVDGEKSTLVVSIENIGSLPIDTISLTVGGDKMDKGTVVTWDEQCIARNLPLPPGRSFELPLHVHARYTDPLPLPSRATVELFHALAVSAKRSLKIQYGSPPEAGLVEPPARRVATVDLPIFVSPGLCLLSTSIHPDGYIALEVGNPSNMYFTIHPHTRVRALGSLAASSGNTPIRTITHHGQKHGHDSMDILMEPGATQRLFFPTDRFPVELEFAPHKTFEQKQIEAYERALVEMIALEWKSSVNTGGSIWLQDNLTLTASGISHLMPTAVTAAISIIASADDEGAGIELHGSELDSDPQSRMTLAPEPPLESSSSSSLDGAEENPFDDAGVGLSPSPIATSPVSPMELVPHPQQPQTGPLAGRRRMRRREFLAMFNASNSNNNGACECSTGRAHKLLLQVINHQDDVMRPPPIPQKKPKDGSKPVAPVVAPTDTLDVDVEIHLCQDAEQGVVQSDLSNRVMISGSMSARLYKFPIGHLYAHPVLVCFTSPGTFKAWAICRDATGRVLFESQKFAIHVHN